MKAAGDSAGKGFVGGPNSDVHHFCSHSSGLNSVTRPHGAVWDLQPSHGARRKETRLGETQRVLATSISPRELPFPHHIIAIR